MFFLSKKWIRKRFTTWWLGFFRSTFIITTPHKMVELLNGFPPHVVAYCTSDKMDKEDYKKIVASRINEVVLEYDKINFLVLLPTDIDQYTLSSLLDYLKISFEHCFKWEKMAVVSNQKGVRGFYERLSPFVLGKLRGYEVKDFEEARQWVSSWLDKKGCPQREQPFLFPNTKPD